MRIACLIRYQWKRIERSTDLQSKEAYDMQFVVTAHDFKDEDAINRRMAMRDEHLVGATKLMAVGVLLSAGAFLNEEGKMIGSSLLYEIDSKEELDNILNNDPYIRGKVWESFEIKQIKLFRPIS